MARIDKLINAMRQHNAQRCLLASDQPARLIVNGRQISGTAITAEQLEILLSEITPSGKLHPQSADATYDFEYSSPMGLYGVSVQRTNSLVRAVIVERPAVSRTATAPGKDTATADSSSALPDDESVVISTLEQPLAPTLLVSLDAGSNVRSLALSADGQSLACGCLDSKIRIWDMSAGGIEKTLTHSSIPVVGSVTSLSFLPMGKSLISGSNGKLSVWNLASGKTAWAKKGLNKFYSVACSSDGSTVASADGYGYVSFWNSIEGNLLQSTDKSFIKGMAVLDKSPAISFVAFQGGGKTLACGRAREAKIYDVKTGNPTKSLTDNVGGALAVMMAMSYSRDGKSLAAGFASTGDTKVVLWNTETGSQRPLKSHGAAASALAFSPNSKVLATGSKDGTVKMWDVESGELLRTIQGHRDAVNAVAFSNDGQLLASGSDDHSVRLFRLA